MMQSANMHGIDTFITDVFYRKTSNVRYAALEKNMIQIMSLSFLILLASSGKL
jgi:hypothetical protein